MTPAIDFFGRTHQAARTLAQEIVTKTGESVEKAVRMRQLKLRAGWTGWRIVDCGGERYALVRADDELVRYPDSGTVDVATVERFIETRERERW